MAANLKIKWIKNQFTNALKSKRTFLPQGKFKLHLSDKACLLFNIVRPRGKEILLSIHQLFYFIDVLLYYS